MPTPQDAEYWEGRYRASDAPWDLGEAAPALLAWLADHPGEGRRVLVPGCGPGHDALALAKAGYAVTAVDFAPAAVAATLGAARSAEVAMAVREADVFALTPADVGTFDLWFEHTCFCAINPVDRPRYVAAAARLLRPEGTLLGVFYTHNEPAGPPFDVRPAQISDLFGKAFETVTLAPCSHSVARRAGDETWGVFRPLPAAT